MDVDKFKIWKSGMTEADREEIRKNEEVQAIFKKEATKVATTINSKGWKIIMDKMIIDQSVTANKLATCKEKDLARLQLEIKIRKEFLDKWTPYTG